MKIQVNLYDPKSIDNAIRQINAYKKRIEEMANDVISELARMGEQIVDTQFSLSGEDYDISCEINGNYAMIIAEGENVVFLEFGTGVDTEVPDSEMESSGLPPIYAGSWSETEGRGVFYRFGHWYYQRKLYTGTMATRGFYFASKEIRERAVEVARKAFKK